ncbi:MAG: SDR family NAD(P)-dependent oxidoreductase [Halodesulfovibrio sp.]|uniref:SDR family NAD(P)-dependent oxidoreductase n=1 Tax=Halodesulfovibrio sp. TaxID=1912772 RepID=UPI00359EDFC2
MKNILLTGGAGYIGSHTVVELLENGFTLICVDNFTNSSPEVFDRLERITEQKVIWYDADIRDKKLLCSIVEDNVVDGVITLQDIRRLVNLLLTH